MSVGLSLVECLKDTVFSLKIAIRFCYDAYIHKD